MTEATERPANDWAGTIRGFALAWGLPSVILVAGTYFDEPARAVVWSVALAWMGTACLLNARRCGRTHCRFTGPYFLVLIVPVLLQGFGVLQLGPNAWWILGGAILLGGNLIWCVSEAVWGKYTSPR